MESELFVPICLMVISGLGYVCYDQPVLGRKVLIYTFILFTVSCVVVAHHIMSKPLWRLEDLKQQVLRYYLPGILVLLVLEMFNELLINHVTDSNKNKNKKPPKRPDKK